MRFKELPVVRPELLTLGKKLGETRLRSIVRGFYDRMKDDLLIGFFFDGKDLDAIARGQSDFLMRAMGLALSYSGKAPADAHDDIAPILAGHFDRRLTLLDEHLTAEGLSEEERRVWVGFENAFRSAIVVEEGPLTQE
jgi:truncated hemoglobin YjbI